MARPSLINALRSLLDAPTKVHDRDPLVDVIRKHMPDANEDTLRVVTAVTGLLASVAFADAVYSEAERRHVREELGRVHGLGTRGVETICKVLESDIGKVVSGGDQRWVRDLKSLTDHDQRYEVLEVLMDLAAADDDFSTAEQNYLRRLATALGLSQGDYNSAQSRHRDKLAVLRPQ